jgi:hypothetical protein
MVNQTPQSGKLDQILELYKGLSAEEKSQFVDKIAEDEDLMTRLLDLLLKRNQAEEQAEQQTDFTGTDSYIDFLKRVKE